MKRKELIERFVSARPADQECIPFCAFISRCICVLAKFIISFLNFLFLLLFSIFYYSLKMF